MQLYCVNCGKSFNSKFTKQKFCCTSCKYKYPYKNFVFVKISKDQFEFIEAMADTPQELAKQCGVTTKSIQTIIARKNKKSKPYFLKVYVGNEVKQEKGAI